MVSDLFLLPYLDSSVPKCWEAQHSQRFRLQIHRCSQRRNHDLRLFDREVKNDSDQEDLYLAP